MPAHSHPVEFNGEGVETRVAVPTLNEEGTREESEGNILANNPGTYGPADQTNATLASFVAPVTGSVQTGSEGGSNPVNNMQPFLTVNYCICLQGIYPSRD